MELELIYVAMKCLTYGFKRIFENDLQKIFLLNTTTKEK